MPAGSIADWYERLLDAILRVALVLGSGLAGVGSVVAWRAGEPRQIFFYFLVISLLTLITFSHEVEYFIRAGVFLLFLYILGLLSQTRYFIGFEGNGELVFMTFSVLSAVLLGRKVGFMALILSVGTMFIFALLYAGGLIPPPHHLGSSTSLVEWVDEPLQLFVFGTGTIVPISYLLESFRAAFMESERARVELEAHRQRLHHMVEERTAHLERRTRELQVAAEVARDAALATNLDDLLNQAVNLIRDQFGFYHAGLFLVDEHGEYAVLRAATGGSGQKMLAEHHKLKVGEVGIVGYVTATGESRIALDVGTDAAHFKNPLLPRTRSELALPLRVGDRVIGALDVQSERPEAFDDDDVAIFQVMADQLAVAIERTRLFEQVRATLERRLESVISNTPIVLLAVEPDGTISLARGKALARLRHQHPHLVGRSVKEIFGETHAFTSAFRRALAGVHVGTLMEFSGRLFEWSLTPLVDEDHTVSQVLAVAMDVTELKKAEVALHQRNQLLTALHQTALEIMGHLEMEELLRLIVTRAAGLVDSVHGYVTLMEPDGSALVTRVGIGLFATRIGDRLKPGQGVAGRVWQNARL
ncbi:MAG: GAF domain-containing protein [Ardenticatenia bacterium]|nr:GAF domain-containing protein [Ardenticatenia bacterium]